MTAKFLVRGPVLTGAATIALLMGTLGLWSVTATLTGAVIAAGEIGVEQDRQVVQHPDGGVVAAILVTEGARVTTGQILMRLDGTVIAAELALVDRQRLDLAARRARLEAERDNSPGIRFPAALQADPDAVPVLAAQAQLFAARRDTATGQAVALSHRGEQARRQIDGIDAQASALTDERRLTRQQRETVQTLVERGLAEGGRLLALQREEARLTGAAGELAAARASANARIAEISGEALRLAAARREAAHAELRDLDPQGLQLDARRAVLAERLARLDITAPVSGVVLGLAITTPRAVLRPADTVLAIVPQDRPLTVTARIPVLQVDDVRPGQAVALRVPAAGHRDLPDISGTVTALSPDTLHDDRTGQAYYRADIAVEPGQAGRLRPGMPVEAFIRTGDYTPFAYLVQPVADAIGHALREGRDRSTVADPAFPNPAFPDPALAGAARPG